MASRFVAIGAAFMACTLWFLPAAPAPAQPGPAGICASADEPDEAEAVHERDTLQGAAEEGPPDPGDDPHAGSPDPGPAGVAEPDILQSESGIGNAEPDILQLATHRGIWWSDRAVLRVRFLNGPEQLREAVMRHAATWSQYCSLRFQKVVEDQSEIRVMLQPGNYGGSSRVGRGALRVAQNQPTMTLEVLNDPIDEDAFRRVVLHEFGHAIGFIHEHQSPAGRIPWNREAVFADMRARGHSDDWVVSNIFDRVSSTNFSQYDPRSIMHYWFPAQWTLDGTQGARNTVLSDTDKAFVGTIYPLRTDRGSKPARQGVIGIANRTRSTIQYSILNRAQRRPRWQSRKVAPGRADIWWSEEKVAFEISFDRQARRGYQEKRYSLPHTGFEAREGSKPRLEDTRGYEFRGVQGGIDLYSISR